MKKITLLQLVMDALFSAQAQQKFTIKGKLSQVQEGKAILHYSKGDLSIYDSAIIKKGVFQFKGQVTGTQKAFLLLRSSGNIPDYQQFFLEGGTFTVTGSNSMKEAVISGDKTQSEYGVLLAQEKPLTDKEIEIGKQYQNEKEEAVQKELASQYNEIEKRKKDVEDAFIHSHADSYLSLELVRERGAIIDDVNTFELLFNALSDRLRNGEGGKVLGEKIAIVKRTAIGQPAIDFTQNNTEGKPVTLFSFKGKYVLLDFWASWCGPCRAENPNVLKAWNRFKDKNFEVLAVSLDDNRDRWLKAIKDDGMPWTQVSDLQGTKNAVAVTYAIQAIPQNLLIGPDGKIIAKNLRGEALEKALEEHVK